MKRAPGNGLFLRTFAQFLLVPLVALTLFALIMGRRQRSATIRGLEAQVRGIAVSLVTMNGQMFVGEDYPALVDLGMTAVKENPAIDYLVITRHGGKTLLCTASGWQELSMDDASTWWARRPGSEIIGWNPVSLDRVYHCVHAVAFQNLEWGWLSFGASMKDIDAQVRTIYRDTFALGGICMLLSALLAWAFTRSITAPLLHLKDVAERIRGGDFRAQARVETGDEVQQLAETFNTTARTLGDLTERLEARVQERTEELRHSEERYRLLFENAAEAILVLGEGRLRFWNPALERITGFDQALLCGARFADLVLPEDRVAFLELMARAEAAKIPVGREGLRLRGPKGETWVNATCAVIPWDGDTALLLFIQDVSERRVLQAQLLQAQKMEAIGTLAGGIAHDFNNILAAILANVSLLQKEKEPGTPDHGRLKRIETAVESATGLTRRLLGFAKGGTYEVRTHDLNKIVLGAVGLFSSTRRELEVRLELSALPCAVECDQHQIEQVLLNLFVNAAQAMPGGGLLVIASAPREGVAVLPSGEQAAGWVELRVQDSGTGMDEATMSRIFEPFFTTKAMGGGTGLGLASAYSIVQVHHGTIHVESRLGQGSTFTINLPRAGSLDRHAPQARTGALHAGKGTILLVDDQEILRDVTRDLLELLGYTVLCAEGGAEAVRLVEEGPHRFDLVILDMIMPGMGGAEAFGRIRAAAPGLRVLLASGYSLEGDVSRLLEAGCDGFLQKPFNARQLSRKIEEVLRGTQWPGS